jgi:hypothetical protein
VENAAKRPLHIVARRSEPANSGGAQSSGESQEDLRERLTVFTSSDDGLFAPEPEWSTADLSARTRAWAADDGPGDPENDDEPLFLDEPDDLPTLEPLDTSHLDGLFADEREGSGPAGANAVLPAPMRVEAKPVARPRTAVLIAVIVAGSAAGFVLAYVLLN